MAAAYLCIRTDRPGGQGVASSYPTPQDIPRYSSEGEYAIGEVNWAVCDLLCTV